MFTDIDGNKLDRENTTLANTTTFSLSQIGFSDAIFLNSNGFTCQVTLELEAIGIQIRFLTSIDGENYANLDAGNRIFDLNFTEENNGNETFTFTGKIRWFKVEYIAGSGAITVGLAI